MVWMQNELDTAMNVHRAKLQKAQAYAADVRKRNPHMQVRRGNYD